MTSIKAYLYERAVSPLLGSLIISWCAWNYRLFFLAVSDLKYAEKMAEIDRFYQLEDTHNLFWLIDWTVTNCWSIGVVFPVLTSMAYLFIFPFPAKWVYSFSLGRQKAINDLKNEKQQNELLTLEQSKAVRNQLAEAEKHFDEQLERKDRAIELRDKKIEELEATLAEQNSESKQVSPEEPDGVVLMSEDEQVLAAESPLKEQPDYIRFLKILDDKHRNVLVDMLSLLMVRNYMHDELVSHFSTRNGVNVGKLLGQMKLYKIIETYTEADFTESYMLGVSGEELYKYVLERANYALAV